MLLEDMMAYSEVYEILNLLEKEYRDRVPQKIIELFEEERLKDYKPEINVNVSLLEQNLQRGTIVLLSILNLNYWCDSEEEKQEILNELKLNEKELKDLEEKYNPDNLFKKKPTYQEQPLTEELSIIEYKKSNFIHKLLNKIKKLFKISK